MKNFQYYCFFAFVYRVVIYSSFMVIKRTYKSLYDNTKVNMNEKICLLLNPTPMFFGNNKNEKYNLSIRIEEKQTKRSVEQIKQYLI